ncbi:acyl-CoA thioesterase [Brucella anthropi]|jgi:acyl-CoA thioester hydrolase|uniref:acyl-CoA thioesterase n=1 Tax=Brucella TaxID=234 RepID=UPI00039A705A|nr:MULTISPECIES: acyl-CoA thioesterase [Brucella/Ochrobactrum group]KAB2757058.1 acyl-CoA thioesterase [Brucella anthropi]MBA8860965.1 acyl-CoA thioester hydrolase [Brucella anthropi]MBM6397073.1 acyl-CoA thioesterase [Brucella anthropi]NIH76328.1 acyl-CoA thioester hydrolase [Ochrobactrum sp. P20RRXII]PQZ63792.1 4-hydroxybenzoyl-CoA thioesterase [Ochrobactrum sp. MYb49]
MSGLVTFVGVAHPWMCDVMGHMNVRHYAGMFDDASFQLLGHIAGKIPDDSFGWADVRATTEYKQEAPAGDLLTVRSHVLKVGRSSITFRQMMVGSLDGELRAVNETTTVCFDKIARRSTELGSDMRVRAEKLLADYPAG